MNANLQEAELMVVMGDPKVNQTADEVEPTVEQPQRSSPTSAVCYANLDEAPAPAANHATSSHTIPTADSEATPTTEGDAGSLDPRVRADEFDTTPRSEVPSVSEAVNDALQRVNNVDSEPSYFSPQPLRVLSTQIPKSNPSTNPSPTTSLDPSNGPAHGTGGSSDRTTGTSALVEHTDRPAYQRDLSSTSTASVATVRANSVDATPTYPIPLRRRDGPVFPNQSYAALQSQQYPAPYPPHILRTKSSHPAHHSGYSVSHISTFGLPGEHQRDIMDTGSRTVGNSPAGSPGLFNPTELPLRPNKQSDESLFTTPWLHYTHRQAPKETHVADVDVDPVSGRKLVNHYEVIDELGRGVHGKVKRGRNLETGDTVAIKIVDRFSKRRRLGKNTSHEDKIKREIAILKKARHEHIVGLIEVIDDPSKKKVYIVLEHVERGEVKWRTEGAKEVCLVEWRRYQRESDGIFDNESAALEDEKIIRLAHQKLERQQRRRARQRQERERQSGRNGGWSFELGGDSDDECSENEQNPRASLHGEDKYSSWHHWAVRQGYNNNQTDNMETAFRSSTPMATARPDDTNISTGLEGTMYGAYDTEAIRGRTPSLAGSNSSHFTDGEEEVPEHFRYVPLMTIQAARETFRDTVLGLEYLHYQRVIHRDIKPANLLVTTHHRIKISDFGVSFLGRQPSSEPNGDQSESDIQGADEAIELAKTVGTPAFYAPELCNTELDIDTPKIGPEIDVWALGVTLYCLIYGRVPFHDHNQWLLMRHITDDEPYISKFRLKPVAEASGSRPNSHGRLYHSMTTSRRAPHDLEYEEVDEDLRDLLQRLLIKDPRRRITIGEIKRHPWLTRDIENFNSWVEETDPDKSSHGRRIEISKDDIDKAVVPFNLMDRVLLGIRKAGELAKSLTRRESRKRATSSASGRDTAPARSANSSSSTISQDSRRPSLGPGMYIYEALSKSREPEHPLSQSVTASPEASERLRYFESPNSRTASPAHSTESREHPGPLSLSNRPSLPERAFSALSTATSIRTVRQSDLSGKGRPISPGIPPALPGTPTALDTPGGSSLGGIFGGVPKRAVHEARSQEKLLTAPREHTRAKSIDRLVGANDDPHTGPSLAISTAVASGHVDQPDLLKELSPSIIRGTSPAFSDIHPSDVLERASSRQSSVSSASSRLHRSWAIYNQELEVGPSVEIAASSRAPLARDTSNERFSRAKDEFVRRRVREEQLNRERPRSGTYQRPSSSLDQVACPPSPDDETFFQRQKLEEYLDQQQQASHGTSPITYPIITSTQPRTLTSSSSEDHFTSMSQSTSNPSIPSVASANSSIAPDECLRMESFPRMAPVTSGDSIHLNQFDAPTDDPAGYDGDHAVESDEDEDSDEEDFLVMGKKKPTSSARSESISNGELARSGIRKEITSRRRSARSGSNGTVKKIPTSGASGDERASETQ